MTYKSYHTNIKLLCRRDSLPSIYQNQITRSNLWRWKKEPGNKYIGTELSEIKLLESFIQLKTAKNAMRMYLKIAFVLSALLTKTKAFKTILKEQKENLVDVLLHYKKQLNYKIILKLLNVPISVFYYWETQAQKKCDRSPVELCTKKYPGQLTKQEVVKMKELLIAEEYQYWPVCSIAFYALRKNILNIALQTWYKYIKKLGIKRPGIHRKKRYPKGVTASYPNEYWHADITIVKSLNGIKNYVYLLMDNFSKYIINWRVESVVSGSIRLQTIKEAYQSLKKPKQVNLVIDGGTENCNNVVDDYVQSDEIKIIKLVALKDIPFSNSLVEAQNKLLKYRYLFKQQFEDINDLRKSLDWIIEDYNNKRPHISLKGLTPYEAYNGIVLDGKMLSEQMKMARIEKKKENQRGTCKICD